MKKPSVDAEAPVGPSFDEPLFAARAASPAPSPSPTVGERPLKDGGAGSSPFGAGAPSASPSVGSSKDFGPSKLGGGASSSSGAGAPGPAGSSPAVVAARQSDVGPAGLPSSSPSGEAPSVGRGEDRGMATEGVSSSAPAPTGHHPHGMSRWPAVLECPCFEGRKSSADAALGTKVHAFLAWLLTELKERGRLPEVEVESLSIHEAGALRAARWVADTLREELTSPRALRVEERVTVFDSVRKEQVFGTADCLWVHGSTVTVLDFKTFWNPGRDYIAQLAGYGYGAACASKTEVTHIRCVVAYGDHAGVDEQVITKEDAARICARALAAFGGSCEPKQCAWCELCSKFSGCPACVRTILPLGEPTGKKLLAEAWPRLPSSRKAQLLVLAEFAIKWSEAVRESAKADLLMGEVLEDPENGISYVLRSTRGRLKLDCDALWAAAKERGVTKEAFKACLKPDATEAKKALRAAGLTAKAADDLLETCGSRGAGSQTLARA